MKKIFTDRRIELMIRFWAAGAVYLFIGWGSGLGQSSALDFIFVLGLVLAVFEMFVVNPVINQMLRVKRTIGYMDTTIGKKVRNRLLHVLRDILMVSMVAAIYTVINQTLIILFSLSADTVVIPGEPILFGVFYLLVYCLQDNIVSNVKNKLQNNGVSV